MEKYLITGASGFIGRYLVKKLISDGCITLGLSSKIDNVNDRVVGVDLRDRRKLHDVIQSYKPTRVIHLAAIANPCYGNVAEIYDVNVAGSENLLEELSLVSTNKIRVLMISTAGVYGNQPVDFLSEDLPFNPVNHYSYSKVAMEFLCRRFTNKLDITIPRLFNVIGEGQNANFIVPKLVNAFKHNSNFLEIGNLKPVRDYVDVDFVINCLTKLVNLNSIDVPVVNICSGIGTSVEGLIKELSLLTGLRPEIRIVNNYVRSNDIYRLVGSTKLMNSILDCKCLDVKTVLTHMLNG